MPEQMTREQAVIRRAELLRDREFGKRYLAGDAAARTEMAALHRILAGVPTRKTTPSQDASTRRALLVNDPAWRQRYLAGDGEARAEMAGLIDTIAAEEDQ